MMRYVDYIYDIVKAMSYTSPELDLDYLLKKVGDYGVDALLNSGLLERSHMASKNSRTAYILKDKERM